MWAHPVPSGGGRAGGFSRGAGIGEASAGGGRSIFRDAEIEAAGIFRRAEMRLGQGG
jgi:hypothetical protein